MRKLFCIISFLFLAGCTSPALHTDNLADLQLFDADNVDTATQKSVSPMRHDAIKETALRFGAQAGLAHRSREIDALLKKRANYLDGIFNFNAMMLEHGVLPPVLEQADNNIHAEDATVIRIAKVSYKIIQQARFATTAPNWREYLWQEFDYPEPPHKTLLPRNDEERTIWKKYTADGWMNGKKQSDSIFRDNTARLKRDYQGMILYRQLLAQHMVSKPYVASTDLGVTGDGNAMHINDKILRITALPSLQTDAKSWRPILVKPHD